MDHVDRYSSLSLFLFSWLLILPIPAYSQSLPNITTHPQGGSYEQGSTITLNCALNCSSCNLTIQWAVNNTELSLPSGSYTKNGNSLVISNFDGELNGNYTCLASNGDWTLRSATAEIRLKFIKSPNDGGTTSASAMQDHLLAVDCIPEYSAYPMDEISFNWDKKFGSGYISLDNSNNPVVSSNGTLYLLRVTAAEEYRCKISNDGETISHNTQVSVTSPISPPPGAHIINAPQDVIANEGDTVSFHCIAGGDPLSTISWEKPSNSTSQTAKQQGGTQFLIADVKKSDEGQFTCSATELSDTYSATLRIRDPPSFTQTPPSSVVVTYGEQLSLTCQAAGDDVDVVWYHNGELVSSSPALTIANTDTVTAGAYQCYATGPKDFITTSTLVTVQTIAPTFLPNGTLSDQVAFSGRNLTLSCLATGAPKPTYRWTKDGVDANGFAGFDLSIPGSLTISEIIHPLQGNYTCIVENEVEGKLIGRQDSSAFVAVVEPTVITTVSPVSLKSHIGDPFHLNCTVTHDTKTSVQLSWIFNGQKINSSSQLMQIGQKSLRLNITSATMSNQGVYQCIARTVYTKDPSFIVPEVKSSITTVEITDVPIEPSVSQVRAVGPSTLEVSWTYRGFLDNLKEYQIESQINGDTNWYNHGGFPKSGTTIRNVTGLQPYTEYNIRVVAVLNNEGEVPVPSSTYGPIRTKEDIPSNAPVNIDALVNSTTTISIQFEAPSRSNGIIVGYTIRYWTNDTRNNTVTEVFMDGNTTTFLLTGLIPNTTYWIQVAAHTAAGRGPFSSPMRVVTIPTITRVNEEDEMQFYSKIWFILICVVIAVIVLVILVATIAALRWRSIHKGNKFTIDGGLYAEELSLSADVVDDYDRRRDAVLMFSESVDGSRSNLNNAQFNMVPSFVRSESFRGSIKGSLRGSMRSPTRGYNMPPPPEYVNPPSFEETLKNRLSKTRSASTSLLDKTNHHQLHGSGWSVGHDPKSAFFTSETTDPESDSMIGKPRFPDTEEDISSDASTGFHSQSITNVESFATFV